MQSTGMCFGIAGEVQENPSNLAFSLFHCNFISIHAISCHNLYQSITLAHSIQPFDINFPTPKNTWQTPWCYRTSLLWRHRATLEILHVQLPSKHVSWGMMRGSKRSPNSPHTKKGSPNHGDVFRVPTWNEGIRCLILWIWIFDLQW